MPRLEGEALEKGCTGSREKLWADSKPGQAVRKGEGVQDK
jgi:hypothetical protein